jgi:hypothetical protein
VGDGRPVDGSGDSAPGDDVMGDDVMGDDVMGDDVMVCRVGAVLTRRLLDGVIVLAPGRDEPVRVSAPGEVLWLLLDEPCAVGDLVAVWSTLYDVEPEAARTEISPVLRAWVDAGAVTVLSSP